NVPQPQARPRPSETNDIKAARDPIAALIGPTSTAAAPHSEADKARVQSAQRALIKLGFVLKADGVMGSSTRQAIEKFERDRNLAVTGDLSPKTIKELSAQSRIAIP
ncbi:MAG: peptidoglycan-binding protein, partial [Alphaproteobacteria bacterium]|nr:peptidoglycan-binding protein [Alphaproteobacteria bacterium]